LGNLEHIPNKSFDLPKVKRPWLLFLLGAMVSFIVALLNEDLVLLIAVLLVGLPFATLVISRHTRPTAIIILLVFVPLTSILKAVTGSRFAPLTFDLALLLAFGLFIGQGLLRHKIRLAWLDVCLAIFLLWAGLQMFNPNVPSLQAGIEGLRKFAFASILFYVGRHFIRTRDVIFFQKSLIIISIFIAGYGLKQFFFMSAIDYRMIELASASPVTYLMGGWVRPFSTLPGPFHLGLYLVVVSLLLIAQLMLKHGRFSTRLFIPLILFLHLGVLFFTRTKGNWVGLVAGISVLMILHTQRPLKLIARFIALSLAITLIVTIIFAVVPSNTLGVLEDAIVAVTNPWEAPTFVYRVQLWEEIMVPALRENPLWGYGTSSAGEGLSNLYQNTGAKHFPSHNLFLKVFLELGLVGLFLFFVIVAGSLWQGWKSVRRQQHALPNIKLTQYWGIAAVIAFLVAGLAIPTLDAYPANYYFWLLLGLLSSREITQRQVVINPTCA
jgi:putative inorganic carbon (hco3(-)) transporter